ncbi:MAG TPA: VCBS repeat-containing protein [Tepidisphaeraceae bacterium]|jgi:hypothetical protein|nr:VCBS repeat-containing protein [Tepidisphaeraceae bacterium]
MKKLIFASLLLSLCTNSLFALFQADLPVSKRFEKSRLVLVGKITAFNPQTGLVVAATTQTLKGAGAPTTFQVHLVKTPALAKAAAVGEPVVIFEGQNQSVVHIADQWASAIVVPNVEPKRWRTFQIDSTGHRDFPGSTAALIPVLQELKAGAYTLLDAYEGKPFSGGVREIARLPVAKPAFMLAADIDGDGKPDLIVGTPDGIKLFLAVGDGYSNATEKWGLSGVAESCAAADIEGAGKISLLIGKTLYRNDGKKLTADPAAIHVDGTARVTASALTPGGDGKTAAAALLLNDGRLLLFKHPAGAGEAWVKSLDRKIGDAANVPRSAAFGDFSGDGTLSALVLDDKTIVRYSLTPGAPPDDFARLTGDPLDQVVKSFAQGMNNAVVTPIDINGDKRPDLLISSDAAALVLINRGFGAFLVDRDAGAALSAPGVNVALAKARCGVHGGAGGNDALLILTDDGKLLSATTPPVKGK